MGQEFEQQQQQQGIFLSLEEWELTCFLFCSFWVLIGGRGGKRGGRGGGPRPKVDKSSLDNDLDAYMLRDKKAGTTMLNEDLDTYFKEAKAKKQAEEEAAKNGTKETTEDADAVVATDGDKETEEKK